MNNDPALPRAVSVIAAFESFRGKAYDDGFGKYTIGYGCTYYPNGQRVVASDGPITERWWPPSWSGCG
jgi:lysozyme